MRGKPDARSEGDRSIAPRQLARPGSFRIVSVYSEMNLHQILAVRLVFGLGSVRRRDGDNTLVRVIPTREARATDRSPSLRASGFPASPPGGMTAAVRRTAAKQTGSSSASMRSRFP